MYSFDSSGEMVQYTERITNSNGSEMEWDPNEIQVKSSDGMALYGNYNLDVYNEYKHVPDKFYMYSFHSDLYPY